MPELPEVETTRRGILPHVKQQRIAAIDIRQNQLRWPITPGLKKQLTDKSVLDIQRRAKYILLRFAHGTLLIHLGMSGSLRITTADAPLRKHDHVIFRLASNKQLRFHDPRRFGCILWHAEETASHPLLATLGPEPLSEAFNAQHLIALSRKRRITIKQFIMQAQIVVGVGNIYASEALFLSGIRPTRPAAKVTYKEYARLTENIKKVLQRSIDQGGTTLRDFVNSEGKPGYFKQSLHVYGREHEACTTCGATIKQKRLGQRSTFYCPECQR